MKTKILTTALSLIFTNLSLQAAGLINGDFETPNLGGGTGANYPFYNPAPAGFGWTIPSGDIDHIGSHWQAASGQQSIDLSGFGTGVIHQDFTFPSAGVWAVTFSMAVNPLAGGDRSVGVGFGLASGPLLPVGSYTLNSAGRTFAAMQWVEQTTAHFIVNTTDTYRLQFVALDGDASGAALDNISLVQVPEPGVASMVLAGAAIVFTRIGMRNRKA